MDLNILLTSLEMVDKDSPLYIDGWETLRFLMSRPWGIILLILGAASIIWSAVYAYKREQKEKKNNN